MSVYRKKGDTLETRAAHYFAVYDEPRTMVKTGRWSCIIVLTRRKALAFYDEQYCPGGEYVQLLEPERKALIEALLS